MVEISTDLKHLIKSVDKMATYIKKFDDTHEDVVLLKEKVRYLENKIDKYHDTPQPYIKRPAVVGTASGGVVVALIEIIRVLIQ